MSMDKGSKLLSGIVSWSKYARYLPELNRRETFDETLIRNEAMHISSRFNKNAETNKLLSDAFNLVRQRKILPSMRSLQFAGPAIEANESRGYNCAYLPVDDLRAFSEVMFLLLGGTGVGYSVEREHVNKLPPISGPNYNKPARKYVIEDSAMGWAEAIYTLLYAYAYYRPEPKFFFGSIREKGARLVTSGGRAPGPRPLVRCLFKIKEILESSIGQYLGSLRAHDIMCHIADAVLSGGIRRAAMISFFDYNDSDMLNAKNGDWWTTNPQRARSNNSIVAYRSDWTEKTWSNYWNFVKSNGWGEPGIYWTNSRTMRSNPCAEAGLEPFTFCNLTEINASLITSQEDYIEVARAAAIIGTFQAAYTDFHYLRPVWRYNTEKDALIGVGITGIANHNFLALDHKAAAEVVVETNRYVASLIGINPAARCTLIKPSGTTSIVLGTTSGIHAGHSEYYFRRKRINMAEALYGFLNKKENGMASFLEASQEKPESEVVLRVPCKSPPGGICREHETALDLLRRMELLYKEWVCPGHNRGENGHSISVTVSIRPNEWDDVGNWLWENRESYACVSVLGFDGGKYVQPPFEEITKEQYDNEIALLPDTLPWDELIEDTDNTSLTDQAACAGGNCEI